MPALRLGGRWMEELGFAISRKLRLQVRDGKKKNAITSPQAR
ncbi:SymE family type I addiction module toxin [Xanthomonas bundabergensis]